MNCNEGVSFVDLADLIAR